MVSPSHESVLRSLLDMAQASSQKYQEMAVSAELCRMLVPALKEALNAMADTKRERTFPPGAGSIVEGEKKYAEMMKEEKELCSDSLDD